MRSRNASRNSVPSDLETPARVVPEGYRQGLITAMNVLLGFSLTFLRFWGFEAPGQWSLRSIVSTGLSTVAVALQWSWPAASVPAIQRAAVPCSTRWFNPNVCAPINANATTAISGRCIDFNAAR